MCKILSRNKPATGPAAGGTATKDKEKKDLPKLEDFLQLRDYSGAMTLLEVWRSSQVILLLVIYMVSFSYSDSWAPVLCQAFCIVHLWFTVCFNKKVIDLNW